MFSLSILENLRFCYFGLLRCLSMFFYYYCSPFLIRSILSWISLKSGHELVFFLEKSSFPLNETSNAPISGNIVIFLLFVSKYLLSGLATDSESPSIWSLFLYKSLKWWGTAFPKTLYSGNSLYKYDATIIKDLLHFWK